MIYVYIMCILLCLIDRRQSFLFVVSVMLWVVGMVHVVDVRVEPVVLVCRVSHLTDSTVRFHQAVLSVHYVTLAVLRLVFVVTSVRVFDAVLVRVMGWRLRVH